MPQRNFSSKHVNIVLATRNGMPWLREQLDSLLAQTHVHWSLWISDDGSGDGTREYLQKFRARYPARVEMIVDGPGRGAAANFMHLLRHPELPEGLVALCDQDDVWLPDKLSLAVSDLEEKPAVAAVWAARYMIVDSNLSNGKISPKWRHTPCLANAAVQNILSGHTLTLNVEALRLVRKGDTPEIPHHDWWIYLLMSAANARIHSSDKLVLKYRQHGENAMGASGLGRLLRLRQLSDGTLGRWINANMQALGKMSDHLTPQARLLVSGWEDPGMGRGQFLRTFGIHRQSRVETAVLHLLAAAGKL